MPSERSAAAAMGEQPAHLWHAHKPETWPFRFATLREDVEFTWMGEWQRGGKQAQRLELVPAGTKVKIVMVSRFGDIGITTDLTAANGYGARVSLDVLERADG